MSAKLAAAKYPLTFRLPPPSRVPRPCTSKPNPPAAPRVGTNKGAPPTATAAQAPAGGSWRPWSPAAAFAPCRAGTRTTNSICIWHGPDAWPRRWRDEVKKKRRKSSVVLAGPRSSGPGDLRCHCATTVAATEAQQEQQQREEEEQMLVARIVCAGDTADQLVEGLLSFGASSCAIEDANVDTPDEQKIFSRGPLPWQSGHRQLWDESQILAYFPADQDVGEALAMAAESAGLKSMPSYKVEKVKEANWVQQVQDMFVPVEVAQGLYIVPKWCTPPLRDERDPGPRPGLRHRRPPHHPPLPALAPRRRAPRRPRARLRHRVRGAGPGGAQAGRGASGGRGHRPRGGLVRAPQRLAQRPARRRRRVPGGAVRVRARPGAGRGGPVRRRGGQYFGQPVDGPGGAHRGVRQARGAGGLVGRSRLPGGAAQGGVLCLAGGGGGQ